MPVGFALGWTCAKGGLEDEVSGGKDIVPMVTMERSIDTYSSLGFPADEEKSKTWPDRHVKGHSMRR